MRRMEFKDILEKYISNLEKDYNYNKKNNNHPIFSVIQNTYFGLKLKYNYSWIGAGVLLVIILSLFSYTYIVTYPINLLVLITFNILLIVIYYVVVIYVIKLPDLDDVRILGDRVLLVREKIKFHDFDFLTIKEMIAEISNIYNTERMAYLKKYYELAKPAFDGNRNKNTNYESNPIDRMIAIDQIIDTTKIPIPIQEKELLLSCLLRFSFTNFSNVETLFRVLTKYKEKEELKENETSKLKALKKSLGNTVNILTKATQSTEAIYSSLPKMN